MEAIREPGGGGLLLPLFEADWSAAPRAVLYFTALLAILTISYYLAEFLLAACAACAQSAARPVPDSADVPAWDSAILGVVVIACGITTPDVLLSIVELSANGFFVGGLGCASVVDVGAFGLLGIGAACALAVPADEVRKIANARVALLLIGSSALAYAFLALILLVTSPGVVEVWEAAAAVAILPVVALILSRVSAHRQSAGIAYALKSERLGPSYDEGAEKEAATQAMLLRSRRCARYLIPPLRWCGGYPAACTCLAYSGLLAAFTGDLVATLGCVLGLSESVTTLYLGLPCASAPQLFCALHAARQAEHADLALAIIAGLNLSAVSVGVGVPWLTAALHWASSGPTEEWLRAYPVVAATHPNAAVLVVPSGALGSAVAAYSACAIVGVGGLMARRLVWKGAELGGSSTARAVTTIFLMGLWLVYLASRRVRDEAAVQRVAIRM